MNHLAIQFISFRISSHRYLSLSIANEHGNRNSKSGPTTRIWLRTVWTLLAPRPKKGRMKMEKKQFSIIGIPKYHSRGLRNLGRLQKLQRWLLQVPVSKSRSEVYFGESEGKIRDASKYQISHTKTQTSDQINRDTRGSPFELSLSPWNSSMHGITYSIFRLSHPRNRWRRSGRVGHNGNR